jgi:hypothetical protein
VGEPVDLPKGVVVDLGEPERFEPARGSWAQVSEGVPAIQHHRTIGIERDGTFSGQLLEREVNRARQVELIVLAFGQNLDELRAIFDQPPDVISPDFPRHFPSQRL